MTACRACVTESGKEVEKRGLVEGDVRPNDEVPCLAWGGGEGG